MFKNRIIWKVYSAWFFKRILPLFLLELAMITGGLYIVARFVFVEKVVSHTLFLASANPLELFYYLLYAFAKTKWLTKLAIIALLSFGVLVLRDAGRVLSSYRLTSKAAKPDGK